MSWLWWLVAVIAVWFILAVAAVAAVNAWRDYVRHEPERAVATGAVAICALWLAGLLVGAVS